MTTPPPIAIGNRLLTAMPPAAFQAIRPALEPVRLSLGQVLIEPEKAPEHVVFPESCVCSIVAHVGDGNVVEAAAVGREGFVGLPILSSQLTTTTTVVQVPGAAWRAPAGTVRKLVDESHILRRSLVAYAEAVFDEVAQSAGCNAMHRVEQRAAKMLLLVRHRLDANSFALTHEYLAAMLGVRRAGVTIAAGHLQKAGAIKYARGQITILNSDALEAMACQCFRMIARRHEQVERILKDHALLS